MKARLTFLLQILLLVVGSAIISACPAAVDKHVIWLVNATNDQTYTTFNYSTDNGASSYMVPLAMTLVPGSSYRLELEASLTAVMTHVGISGPTGGFSKSVDPGFGSGTPDLVIDTQIGVTLQSRLNKSLN